MNIPHVKFKVYKWEYPPVLHIQTFYTSLKALEVILRLAQSSSTSPNTPSSRPHYNSTPTTHLTPTPHIATMPNPNTQDAVYTGNICRGVPVEVRKIGKQCHIPEAALDRFDEVCSLTSDSVSKSHRVLKQHFIRLIRAAIELLFKNSEKNVEEWKEGSFWDRPRNIFIYDQEKRDNEELPMAITAPFYMAENRDDEPLRYDDLTWQDKVLCTLSDVDMTMAAMESLRPVQDRMKLSLHNRWNFSCGLLRRALQVLKVKDVFGNKDSIRGTLIEQMWKYFEYVLEDIRGSICHGNGYAGLEAIKADDLRREYRNRAL